MIKVKSGVTSQELNTRTAKFLRAPIPRMRSGSSTTIRLLSSQLFYFSEVKLGHKRIYKVMMA